MCLKSKRTFPSCWQTGSWWRIKCIENSWIPWTCRFCYASRLLLWSWPLLKSLTFLRTGCWKLARQVLLFPISYPSLLMFFLSASQLRTSAHSHLLIFFLESGFFNFFQDVASSSYCPLYLIIRKIFFFRTAFFLLQSTQIKFQIISKTEELLKPHFFLWSLNLLQLIFPLFCLKIPWLYSCLCCLDLSSSTCFIFPGSSFLNFLQCTCCCC